MLKIRHDHGKVTAKRRMATLAAPGTKPYEGILAESWPKFDMLSGPNERQIDELIEVKMKALFSHYKINPDDAFAPGPKMAAAWADLAWHLARAHVPGFVGAKRGRGAPATRQSDDVSLFFRVNLLKIRDNLSDRAAIRAIVAHGVISGTEEALLKRYKNKKKEFEPLSKMFDKMAAQFGAGQLIQAIQEAIDGDGNDSILSPG